MYAITKIYKIDRAKMEFYPPESITPADLHNQIDLGVTIYLALENTATNKDLAINYSRLITDTALGNCETWDKLATQLTDELVNGYSEEMPGYYPGTESARNPAQIWDVMNTLKTFNVDYGEYISDRHGIAAYKHNLPDLRIWLQEGANPAPHLKNCIPIVNGFICRPTYKEQENVLYAQDGARLCWQTGEHMTPEIQIVDFSLLGDISIHPIYRSIPSADHDGFKVSYASRTKNFSLDADWILTSKYDLTEYTPIVVIAGVAILPDKIKVFNKNSCKFSINTYPWDISLAYKQYLVDKSCSEAEMFYKSIPFEDYLKSQTTSEDNSKDTFVILVHTPRIFVTRVPMDVWANGITINLYTTEGLLLHDRTSTFKVYHCDTYSDHRELILQNMEDLYVADNHYRDEQLTFVRPDCNHHDVDNVNYGTCTMIHLMR